LALISEKNISWGWILLFFGPAVVLLAGGAMSDDSCTGAAAPARYGTGDSCGPGPGPATGADRRCGSGGHSPPVGRSLPGPGRTAAYK
jgi:hypothetical protein